MVDSVQTIIRTVDKVSDNGIDLINKVDSFYNSAWNKLIIFGSVSFAIIGILVPFVIQWYQKKTLKISEELLKMEIENQTIKIKNELLLDINDTLEKKLTLFEQKIEKLNSSSTAKAFQLQGNGNFTNGSIANALSDYIIAAEDYLICEEYENLQTVLKIISDSCLPSLSHEEIADLKITRNCDLDQLLVKLKAKNEKGMFNPFIKDIELKMTKIPKTNKDKIKS